MFEQITKFANEATTTITDAINDNDIGDRFTTTSDQVLDAVLDANRRIVDAAVTTADRFAEQVRTQVTVEMPFADRLPTPADAGERYLEFVERAVSLNRDMNQRVVEMIKADNAKAASDKVTAAAKTVADTATKTVADTTKLVTDSAKSVAKKSPARKAPVKKAVAKKRPAKKTVAKKTVAKKAAASK